LSLNPEQFEAVRHTHTPLLVLAGAGSGKTRVITEKIAHLIRSLRMEPAAIHALTFTNKAAREMSERANRMLGNHAQPATARPQVSTFHSLGVRFLQLEHEAAGLKRNFSILAEDETQALIKDLSAKGMNADTLHLFRGLISRFKNEGRSPEQAAAEARSPREQEAARLYGGYQRRLELIGALDFDDLIARPLALLSTDEALRLRWQQRIGYLLVDEYQDTNRAQYALIKLLVGPRPCLTVVGDDDQSIYAWRGANPENLSELARDYPELRVVKLEQNYRCSKRILSAANTLIARNPHLFEKKLWSAADDGEAINLRVLDTENAEAEFVAAQIANIRLLNQAPCNEFAILYRGNHQSRAFELSLRALQLPYHLSGGTAFFDRLEIRDLVAYLKLVANPDDDSAFLRALGTPKRQIGETTVERLAMAARSARMSMAAALASHGVLASLPTRAIKPLQQFSDHLASWRQLASTQRPSALAEHVFAQSGLLMALKQSSKDTAVVQRRVENVGELIRWLREQENGSGLNALTQALLQFTLAGRDDRDPGNAVRMMTLHSAKGLEFDHVFLVGLEDGTLPHQGAIDEGRLEEERRLLYVGITRARKTLQLTHAKTRVRYGYTETTTPSRFIEELPAAELSRGDASATRPPEQQKQVVNAHLANLKALLGKPPAR
jgi:ATP-dependent DNA helicase Rep